MTQPETLANESYFRFDDDIKQSTLNLTIIKRKMGKPNTHSLYIIWKIIERIVFIFDILDRMYLTSILAIMYF